MGHQQPPTPVVTKIATSDGFVNNNIRQQKSIAIDIRFYWVRYRLVQGQYLVYWTIVKYNLADYFTKHHPTKHQCDTRGTYLSPTSNASKHACCQVPINL